MKKKMSRKVFNSILIPIIAVVCVVATAATSALNAYGSTLDSMVGRGDKVVSGTSNTDDWDTEYYTQEKETATETQLASAQVVEDIADEGIVLMKNNGILPLEKNTTLSPFGYAYMDPVYGGTGSGSSTTESDYVKGPEQLENYFTINSETVNAMSGSDYSDLASTNGTASTESFYVGNSSINQYDASIYDSTKDSCRGTVGVVFIERSGGEGSDHNMIPYSDGTPHYLALTSAEKATIKFAKENCGSVIVVLNVSNVMELDELMDEDSEYSADAIVWTGFYGASGFASLAKVLAGEVNPSGRTVDIYPADLTKDPTYVNFGDFEYNNATWIHSDTYQEMNKNFVEYEEGIYIGYKYYETAAVEDNSFSYDDAVVMPFGYGLSYTTFSQAITGFEEKDGEITVTVEVENTGDVAGKDVVQVYYEAPYTEFDSANGIEKAVTNLAAFGKTDMIPAGGKDEVTLTFSEEDMASYYTARSNGDGTNGCYFLEKGDYEITLRNNSHDVIDTRTVTVSNDIYYDNSNPRQSEIDAQSAIDDDGNSLGYPAKDENGSYVAATNQFDVSEEYMNSGDITNLSRSNWTGTFPTAPVSPKAASQLALDDLAAFDYATDPTLGNVAGSYVYTTEEVTSKADNGLTLSDLRGEDYYSDKWDDLLDQVSYTSKELFTLLFNHNYNTGELSSIGKPSTLDLDGPAGFNRGIAGLSSTYFCSWCCEVLLSSTWNVDLAYEMGAAVAQEGLANNVNGWYAPGMNTHRSPFGGRNFEYYSEDAVLAGYMGANVTSGCADNGLYVYIKHFAMNEQETNRQNVSIWCKEQAIRETYLKGYEICIKNAVSHVKYISDDEGTVSTKVMRYNYGIMTSQSYLGGKSSFYHAGLLTGVLRNEWGFTGMVVTDSYGSKLNWQRDAMLRAGGDMWFNAALTMPNDSTSTTAIACMREAVHHIAYTEANSAVMNGAAPGSSVSYTTSPWRIAMVSIDIVLAIAMVALIIWLIIRNHMAQKNAEKYKTNGKALMSEKTVIIIEAVVIVVGIGVLIGLYFAMPPIAQWFLGLLGLH